jgi:hypothetical protein
VAFVLGCDDGEVEAKQDRGYDYFPLHVGRFQVYDVTEINYAAFEDPDTSMYQLRSEVVDSFPVTGGEYTYVIHRFSRETDSDEWEFLDTWSGRFGGEEAVISEGNVPYLKLAFPLAKGLIWNGNKYNGSDDDEYELTDIDVPNSVNGNSFEQSAVVEQEDYDDMVTKTDQRVEVYARGVGLIRKVTTILNYCTDPICLDEQIIESGIYYKQEISEYGVR